MADYDTRKYDDYGNVKEQDGEKVRPILGGKISSESREAYKTAVNNGNWEKAHSILFEVLTGEQM